MVARYVDNYFRASVCRRALHACTATNRMVARPDRRGHGAVALRHLMFDMRRGVDRPIPGTFDRMDSGAARLAAREAAASIDARTTSELLNHIRRQGIANEGEAIALVEERKRAARRTKRLHHGDSRHKGH